VNAEHLKGKVQTVLGAIEPEALGITSCHEHILWDMAVGQEIGTASEKDLSNQKVSLDNLYIARANPGAIRDNMCQTDESLAIKEVALFKHAGGSTIVELSQNGLHRDPVGLVRVSRATGVNIIMGSGYYIATTHPKDMDTRTEEEIADEVVRDILVGLGYTGIRSGIIGEIGNSNPWTLNEKKVVRACALAQRQTGAPINIHPSISDKLVLENIAVAKDAGADLTNIAISHVDGYEFSLPTLRKILKAGCYVEYDGFGHSVYHFIYQDHVIHEDSDIRRIYDITRLINEGYINQILLGQDLFMKCALTAYGGYGYAHIINNLMPLMRAKRMTEEQIHTLLVENPRRFLQFKSAS
jgi:phosphotriesterase-related protein